MPDVRPLRDLFDDIATREPGAGAGDPADVLRDAGHGDLPPDLVAEAVVSYAGTAQLQVAEALSPFSSSWAALDEDGTGGLDLLSGAALPPDAVADPWALDAPGLDAPAVEVFGGGDEAADLDGLWGDHPAFDLAALGSGAEEPGRLGDDLAEDPVPEDSGEGEGEGEGEGDPAALGAVDFEFGAHDPVDDFGVGSVADVVDAGAIGTGAPEPDDAFDA